MAFRPAGCTHQVSSRFSVLTTWEHIDAWVRTVDDPYVIEHVEDHEHREADLHVLAVLMDRPKACTVERLQHWVDAGLHLDQFPASRRLLEPMRRMQDGNPEHREVVEFLLRHRVKIDDEILADALAMNNVDLLTMIDRAYPGRLHQTVAWPLSDLPQYILDNKWQHKPCPWWWTSTAIHRLGKVEAGGTWLHRAVMKQAPRVVAALLDKGLDPNAITQRGMSPLHLAMLMKSPENGQACIKALLNAGANLNQPAALMKGMTPWELVDWMGRGPFLAIVLEHERRTLNATVTAMLHRGRPRM